MTQVCSYLSDGLPMLSSQLNVMTSFSLHFVTPMKPFVPLVGLSRVLLKLLSITVTGILGYP